MPEKKRLRATKQDPECIKTRHNLCVSGIFSIEKLNISIKKLNISIKKLNISIKKDNIFIKKDNISIEKLIISIKTVIFFIKKMTFFSVFGSPLAEMRVGSSERWTCKMRPMGERTDRSILPTQLSQSILPSPRA